MNYDDWKTTPPDEQEDSYDDLVTEYEDDGPDDSELEERAPVDYTEVGEE